MFFFFDQNTLSQKMYMKILNQRRIPIFSHVLFGVGLSGSIICGAFFLRHQSIWSDYKQKEQRQPKSLIDLFSGQFKYPSTRSNQILSQQEGSFLENFTEIVTRNLETASKSQKILWALIATNSIVFAAWRIPRLSRFMTRNFVHLPIANRPWTLLTCVFSHQSLVHFTFNMMALNSFYLSFERSGYLSSEQTLACYLTAGIFSSLGSHLLSNFIPGRLLMGGLGASGAIFALLGGVAIQNPHSKVGLIFLPGINFEMQDLLPCIVLFDVVGLVLKWKVLDHAAHLVGLGYGIFWMEIGRHQWSYWQKVAFEYRKNRER